MIEIDVKAFNEIKTNQERLAYAIEMVAFWQDVKRIVEGQAAEEKPADDTPSTQQ
jgi:hypothetical protein